LKVAFTVRGRNVFEKIQREGRSKGKEAGSIRQKTNPKSKGSRVQHEHTRVCNIETRLEMSEQNEVRFETEDVRAASQLLSFDKWSY
jgi:predicted transposase YdaD